MGWFPSPGVTAGEYQHIPQQVIYLYYKKRPAPPHMHAHSWDNNDELQQQQWLGSSKSTLDSPHLSSCKAAWKRKDLSHPISKNISINLIQIWTGHQREMDAIREEFTWLFFGIASFLLHKCQLPFPDCQGRLHNHFKCNCLCCEYQDLTTPPIAGYKNLSSKVAPCFVHLLGKCVNWLKETVWKVSSRWSCLHSCHCWTASWSRFASASHWSAFTSFFFKQCSMILMAFERGLWETEIHT